MATSDEEQISVEATGHTGRSGGPPQSAVLPSHTERGGAGGAAMAGGQRFQAQVTAWWAARVLLQTPIGQRYDLPAVSIAERIYCETADSVDDIRIELTSGDRIFGQCKRGLSLSTGEDSEWASVLAQFCGEIHQDQPSSSVGQKRLVLFYERHNGNLEKLKAVLNRYRRLPTGTPIIDAATNDREREIVNNLNVLLDALQVKSEFPRLGALREELLRHAHIKQLRLEAGEPDYLGVADALQNGLLTNPTQTTQTLNSLHRLADDLLAERGSLDRPTLRARLQGEGVALRDSVGFRSDFEKLDSWSQTELAAHEAEGRTRLVIGANLVTIDRPVVAAMLDAALIGSYIVAGSAGSGKTGCLVDLTRRLQSAGFRVWYWAADSLPDHSPQEMAVHLQLDHSWVEILSEAASRNEAVIVVDGLDGLRDTRAQQAYKKLFALALARGVRVIASIRSFDLQYAVDLQSIFPRADLMIPAEFTSPTFRRFSHIFVSDLRTDEFLQITAQLPEVRTVLLAAPQLIPVVLNLFSLDLLCKLIADGESTEEFSSVSTQAQLFERYWARRVTAHALREEMTTALIGLIEKLTTDHTLQVVLESWAGDVKTALFSAGLVRHPASAPGRLADDRVIEFNHHLLFDYAAELLFVRPRRDRLAQELAAEDTWGLFLRPSLLLFHLYVWKNGREDFWETLIELERGTVSMLHKLPGYMVVAEGAHSGEDLQPLLDGSLRTDELSKYWIQILRGANSTASFMSLPRQFNEGRGDYWLEFAKNLVLTGRPELVQDGQWLLATSARFAEKLSVTGRLILNQAAVAMQRYHTRPEMQPSNVLRFAIQWICLTADVDRDASIDALRKTIALAQLRRFGYIQAYEVANQIESIWALDPALAVEVYGAIFGYVEIDKTSVALDNSRILSLTAEKKQEYEMAYHLLRWKFGAFMSAHPLEATQAMIRVVRHYRDQEHPVVGQALIKTFQLNGREGRYVADLSCHWDIHDYDEQQQLAAIWEEHIGSLPTKDDAEANWDNVCDALVVENELAAVWRRLLMAAARYPVFYAPRLWTMLCETAILGEDDTEDVASDCLRSFSPHLTSVELEQIETAVIALRREDLPYTDDEYGNKRLSWLKIKFLLAIPEDRRSTSATDFLSECDPELRKLFERHDSEDQKYMDSAILEEFGTFFGPLDATNPQGADVQSSDSEVLLASAPLMHLTSAAVTDTNLTAKLQELRNVESLLAERRSTMADEQVEKVENRILHALRVIASSEAMRSDELTSELFNKFRSELASGKFPTSDSEEAFNPYLMAADGLLALAKGGSNLPSDLPELLAGLSHHPQPRVRQQFAEKCWMLFERHPEVVWETLESWAEELSGKSVSVDSLREVLRDHWFWFLRGKNSQRADRLLHALWVGAHAQGNRELRIHCGGWMAALWVMKGEESANDVLKEAITSPAEYLKELWGIVKFSGYCLFPTKDERDVFTVPQKLTTSALLVEVLGAVKSLVDQYFTDFEETPEPQRAVEHPEWVQAPGRMFNQISGRIRFTAEELARNLKERPVDERDDSISEWWSYAEPILDMLLSIPHPSFAFNLVEGLERLIEFDFKRVLHWISRATVASAPAGFAGESLAQSRVIEVLERTLAEHHVSLADDAELRADFLQTLEAFLTVGHPGAMSLAVQLDSIFR